jgi:dihydrofolate reductase
MGAMHVMSKLRFNISMSLDGYVAGPNQSSDDPLGERGEQLHDWVVRTRAFKSMRADSEDGETGLDNDRAEHWRQDFGATIMGRNMFGPIRGDWGDEEWRGWWGDNPPYHSPVFVLTHHAHEPIEMEGGTTFHFVTEGPEAALEHARAVAEERDINIGGGASTAQQYLSLGLVDEMEIHVVPTLLGDGERLFDNLAGPPSYLRSLEVLSSPRAAHFRYVRAE